MTIFEGLKIIDRAKLPHPEWEFVRSSRDLKKFYKVKDYVGWTIRTIKLDEGPWKNVYANWVPKKDVPKTLDNLAAQQKGLATFIVYPSWKWCKGGTILIEKDRVAIEAIRGAVVDLMRHGQLTAGYYYQKGRLKSTTGEKNFLTTKEKKIIMMPVRKIKMKEIILEWGITTQGKFIFYRIEKIDEAGKLLIKKYS